MWVSVDLCAVPIGLGLSHLYELQRHHSSQDHVEAEDLLIHPLPAEQVVILFEKHSAKRLSL